METVRSFGFLRRSAFRKAFPIICAVATMIAIGAAGYFYLVPHVVAGTTVEPTSAILEIRGPALLDAIDKVVVTAPIQGFFKTIGLDYYSGMTKGPLLAAID